MGDDLNFILAKVVNTMQSVASSHAVETGPTAGGLVRHGRILRGPATQPAGTTHPVAYELGLCLQLDAKTCLLLASMDEQGGGDLCVGNDAFVFERLEDIVPERAIAVNRADPHYILPRDGSKAFLAKFPAIGGFIPLDAVLDDGSPHPARGRGFLKSTCVPFSFDKTSAISNPEPFYEFIEMAWDGERLTFTRREYVRELRGLPLTGDGPLGQLTRQGIGLLGAFGIKRCGICIIRFEYNGNSWEAVAHGEPFCTVPESSDPSRPGEPWAFAPGECEPMLRRVADKYYLFTRGKDPMGRLYESDDGFNYRLVLSRPNVTVPQMLNVGLDGSLYVATNPGPGWLRNPLEAFDLLEPKPGVTLHDQDGIRNDEGRAFRSLIMPLPPTCASKGDGATWFFIVCAI